MSKEIQTTSSKLEPQFTKVLTQIQQARQRAYSQINKTLVELYWNIGQYISRQVQNNGWGKGIVEDLSVFLKYKDPNIKGFSVRNIWTMKQFYETYQQDEKLPSLMAELSWTHNRRIMSLKTAGRFKDSYVFKFLNMPIPYQEKELNEFYELLEGKGAE